MECDAPEYTESEEMAERQSAAYDKMMNSVDDDAEQADPNDDEASLEQNNSAQQV